MDLIDSSAAYATNEEVARVLFQLASLLDMLQDNPHRVRAYRRAALGVLFLPKPLGHYIAENEDLPLPGVGEHLRGRLRDLINTGHMGVYEALLEDLGEPVVSLLSIRGIGPKTALRLVRELQIGSLRDLAEAARSGQIRTLRGFGPKREAHFGREAEAALLRGAA